MKSLLTLFIFVLPAILFCQSAREFRFDETSVTFPDGTIQNTAAGSSNVDIINIPPGDQLIHFVRASFSGIQGSGTESDYTNHVVVSGIDYCIDTDNSSGYVISPGHFKFSKGNDITTVDLLSKLKNNGVIATVNFKVVKLDNVGSPFTAHEFILTDARVIKMQNRIKYEETKGYFMEEEYILSYDNIEIRNSIGSQESVSFTVPR